MKEIKKIKINQLVKLGGPGSGPNPGDTRGSYKKDGGKQPRSKSEFKKDKASLIKELRKNSNERRKLQSLKVALNPNLYDQLDANKEARKSIEAELDKLLKDEK